MRLFVASLVAVTTAAASAHAQGLSFTGDVALGYWENTDGGSGLESTGGIDGRDSRGTARLGLSVANDFGSFIGQIDLNYQKLERASSALDDDDATSEMLDVTLRAMRDFGGFEGGLFLGYGIHNDYGDSDENMGYRYVGLDVAAPVSFGSVFGQVGFLDSFDEYDEGTQDAPFLRVGATYSLASDTSLFGAVSWAGGKKYGESAYDNTIVGLELGIEKALNDSGLSVYASYDHTRMYYTYEGVKSGDNFGTLWVGLKMNLGGDTKRGGKLPNFGQWVAYNANEIE